VVILEFPPRLIPGFCEFKCRVRVTFGKSDSDLGPHRRTGWRRLIGSPKLQIIFHKRATKYRALLRKMTCKDKGSYESSPPCILLWSELILIKGPMFLTNKKMLPFKNISFFWGIYILHSPPPQFRRYVQRISPASTSQKSLIYGLFYRALLPKRPVI